jgi:hypothetical protein
VAHQLDILLRDRWWCASYESLRVYVFVVHRVVAPEDEDGDGDEADEEVDDEEGAPKLKLPAPDAALDEAAAELAERPLFAPTVLELSAEDTAACSSPDATLADIAK